MGEIETKKTEVREVTSDLSRMKGKFLVRDLKRSWRRIFTTQRQERQHQ